MASIKAMAAIALTLIVAVPILMGYGLASTEESVTSWEVESTRNVSDLLYNYENEYTAEFMSPYNNRELLYVEDSAWNIAAPDYVNVGSTYTSLPSYTTGTGTITLDDATTTSLSGGRIGNATTTGTVITSPMVYVGDYEIVGTPTLGNRITLYLDGYALYNKDDFYMITSGDSQWSYITGSSSSSWSNLDVWTYYMPAAYSVDVSTREYTEIDPDVDADISFMTSNLCSLKIVTSSGTTYLGITTATSILKTTSGSVTVGSTVYENVTGLFIAEQPSVSSITYSYTAVESDGYVDPAGGWTHGYNPVWWLNGQENESVRIMLNIPAGTYCAMGPTNTIEVTDEVYIGYDGTTMTVSFSGESHELGNYSYAMVVFTRTEATVYGLTSWPTLGVWPTTYNSITADYDDLDEAFRYLYIQGGTTTSIYYRVDLAEVVAGTYPSTYNLTFEPYDYYPDVSYTFTVKSVALYGEGFTIVSRDNDTTTGLYFEVEDGKITVNDTAMSVRGLEITTRKNSDDTWNTYVGGELVWENTDLQPYIDIYGHWSLTASLSTLAETTSTLQTWAAGEFAFDKEDFAACGLLVAGACLIGLGMTGSRSGAKMGILLMICGGAGLIYLTLI